MLICMPLFCPCPFLAGCPSRPVCPSRPASSKVIYTSGSISNSLLLGSLLCLSPSPTLSCPFSLLQWHLGSKTQNSSLGFVHQLSFHSLGYSLPPWSPHPASDIFQGASQAPERPRWLAQSSNVSTEKEGGKIWCFLTLGIVCTELVNSINKNELHGTQSWWELWQLAVYARAT